MGNIAWSAEQRRIIDNRSGNLLVSAAAGAGKTAVLVERIFELISDESLDIDIDRLLVMTFTKDAAAQMRERLGDRLTDALNGEPDNRRLLRQQMLLRNAQIVTIDSFCNSVIKEFFHEIDIDPNFRIGQAAELKLMQNDVLSNLLEECYAEHEQSFIDMIESYCPSRNDSSIEELILRLADAAEAQAWPAEWLDMLETEFIAERDGRSGMSGRRKDFLVDYAHMMLEEAALRNDEALKLCRIDGGPKAYEAAVLSDRAAVDELLKAKDFDELQSCFGSIEFIRLSTKKEDRDPFVTEQVKDIRTEYKGILTGLRDKYFAKNSDEIAEELKISAEPVITLINVTKKFMKRFKETKREKSILDFSDLEHYTLEILAEKDAEGNILARPAAVELNRRYREIFVDEYQDSNFVQEQIVEVIAVVADSRLERPYTFMVGDVKQSIYRFRMAKPELFMNRFKAYRADSTLGEAISLGRNFRSRPEVLDAVNDVFYLAMREGIGGINYDREAALVCGQREVSDDGMPQEPESITEVVVIGGEAVTDENGDTASSAARLRELEARYAARRVKKLIDSGYIIDKGKKTEHKAGYGDIVILLRSIKNWAEVYTEAFEAEGIPVYSDTGAGFLASYEISVMLNLLRVLDNPTQDIPLTAVLHSAIAGCSEDDLVEIRTFGGMDIPFWEAVLSYAESGPDEEVRAKAERFVDIYRQLAGMNLNRDIDRVIGAVYDLTGFNLYCAALPGGERRAANLDILMNYASEYEAGSYSGLFSFVRYLEQIIDSEQDLEEAVNAEAGNSVRIMSIHKSKGLEFPIVLIGGMCKPIINIDGNQGVIISSDFGIGANCIRLERRTKENTLRRSIIQLMIKLDNMGEELRLLYVGMTRAKQKLIMMGTVKNFGKASERWERMAGGCPKAFPVSYIAGADSYMDFVYPAALLNSDDFKLLHAADLDGEDAEADGRHAELLSIRESFETLTDGGRDDIRAMLDFEYSREYAEALPVKLSVSEIKHASMIEEGELSPWMDLDNEGRRRDGKTSKQSRNLPKAGAKTKDEPQTALAGNERGTLYHKIMQFIPFNPVGADEVADFLDSLLKSGIIDDTERACVAPEDIAAFLRTELAARMLKADTEGHLRREQPFVLGRRACDIDPARFEGVTDIIPVQGIIDCMFGEDGQYVILDYKTDKVAEGEDEVLVRRYHSQLENYAEAVSRIIGAPVKECYIYSFTLRKVIRVK